MQVDSILIDQAKFGQALRQVRASDDPLVLAGVVATLLLATLAARLIPARRAISVEPAIALKTDWGRLYGPNEVEVDWLQHPERSGVR